MQHAGRCDTKKRTRFDRLRSENALSDDSLGFTQVLDSSAGVIVSIFTSIIYTYFSGSFPSNRRRQITLLLIAFSVEMFAGIKWFVRSRHCYFIWQHSESWCQILFQVVQFFRALVIFLMVHFLSNEFFSTWTGSHLSAWESVASIYMLLLVINFFINIARKW